MGDRFPFTGVRRDRARLSQGGIDSPGLCGRSRDAAFQARELEDDTYTLWGRFAHVRWRIGGPHKNAWSRDAGRSELSHTGFTCTSSPGRVYCPPTGISLGSFVWRWGTASVVSSAATARSAPRFGGMVASGWCRMSERLSCR